jgi:hypothetical protein
MNFDFSKLKAAVAVPSTLDLTPAVNLDFSRFAERLHEMQEMQEKVRTKLRAEYARRRRCTGTKPDGQLCKAWAVWHASEQKCIGHLSPEARAAHQAANQNTPRKTPRPTCNCKAYPFPHRPGTGYCLAPDPPFLTHLLPAGKRRAGKKRRRDEERARKKYRSNFGL